MIKKLLADYPDRFGFSISHTTRSIRGQEQDGVEIMNSSNNQVDYHFTTIPEMERRIKNHEFIEYAFVHGNYYGTSFKSVERVIEQKRMCLLDIDIQGVKNVMKKVPNATTIFITPPSIEELSKRLHKRQTDSEEAIQLRLKNSVYELEVAKSLPFTYTIVNDDLERAYQELVRLLAIQ